MCLWWCLTSFKHPGLTKFCVWNFPIQKWASLVYSMSKHSPKYDIYFFGRNWRPKMSSNRTTKIKSSPYGTLSIGNFILMIKIIFYIFSCPVTDQQPENMLPISAAKQIFLFTYFFIKFIKSEKLCWLFNQNVLI
jgi:hypothetical protein